MYKQDIKFKKKNNKKGAQIFEQSEKDVTRKYEQVMTEIEK